MRAVRRGGFTLVEALVSLALGALLLSGSLVLLVRHARLARHQSARADLGQSLRVVRAELYRTLLVAARSRLGSGPGASLLGLESVNNSARGSRVGGLPVEPGTDVLIIRTVFDQQLTAVESLETADEDSGALRVAAGEAADALADLEPGEALVTVTPEGGCDILELVEAVLEPDGRARLDYRTAGSELAEGYRALAARCRYRTLLSTESMLGVLAELRYFVRAGEPLAGQQPALWRMRFLPGTERRHRVENRATGEILPGACDLQIALGFDGDLDGRVAEGVLGERAGDEWWRNDPADLPPPPGSTLSTVRLSVLVRASTTMPGFLARPIEAIEDHVYGESEDPPLELRPSRAYLRGRTGATLAWGSS